ncbi:replicative DNA helicase [Clostridium thermarum]|uniref:replicative DNA helicase n=1 Tax=Clostridium thermarum TaxID=1716543 RepID=UPI00111F6180|nr:replicative DNA helicase [Clostridium thermarum]
MINQPLPNDIEAERALLSSIFQKNDVLVDIVSILKASDFYNTAHQIIFEKLVELYIKNIPIDLITFTNNLEKEKLQSIGGITYLSQVIDSTATTAHYKNHAKIIKNLSDKRQIIKGCREALEIALKKESDPKKIIDKLETEFIGLNDLEEEKTVNATELMEYTLNHIEKSYQRGGKAPGIPTGYALLDRALGGLVKGDLYIVAARPSMGKTALTMNIISHIPKQNNVMLFEMEMSKEKMGIRLLAPRTLLQAQALSRGELKDSEFDILTRKAAEIAGKNNIFLNCKAGLNLAEIRAEAKKIKLKHGLDVLFIDHIGKIRPDNPKAPRNDQVGQISEGLKNLAKDLDVCVVALSQLNRAVEARADKHPQLSDLRDSGNIEQDADIVMFLYRDDYYAERENRESRKPGILEIALGKQRDGEVGIIELSYNTKYQIITEIPPKGGR